LKVAKEAFIRKHHPKPSDELGPLEEVWLK
jgi:hypothetical protein